MIDERISREYAAAYADIDKEKKVWCDRLGAPMPETIEVLNLVMKKENALRILHGEKNVEYRPLSEHYAERLYDKKVMDFYERHKEDDGIADEYGHYGNLDPLRQVRRLHFHNYANSWYLDVEVCMTDSIAANEEGLDIVNNLGDHELDKLVKDFESRKEDNRPMFFIFGISKVLGTNLE